MMTAPRTFGGLFGDDSDKLDDSKVLESQEPSELYVLDEHAIQDLQREYPALRLSIQSRLYNDFDIILDHISRVSRRHPTPHALCAVFYLVPSRTSC